MAQLKSKYIIHVAGLCTFNDCLGYHQTLFLSSSIIFNVTITNWL